jgi:cytochrome c
VLLVEKGGAVFHWTEAGGAANIGTVPNLYGDTDEEFGLVAIAADPAFAENGSVFLMFNTTVDAKPVQRVSRLHYDGQALDFATLQTLLEYPVDPNCCHTGGGLEFNSDGVLFIATGDNTMPWSDDGYAPIDNRPDRVGFDARRSAGNTNDLRGKILRIRPTADGYDIPEGNLFANAEEGRPEIYVMGARNPYTITLDGDVLYYGDVGPDGREEGARGPRGYDEINRVTAAGNFGWPLVIADNKPYHAYNYETNEVGEVFDLAGPTNDSPRNTGAQVLPPAQPALIYYPYDVSEQWPMLGEGGRNALVAGVYHRPRGAPDRAFPRYYEDKLFIADFMRRWIMVATIDRAGEVTAIEPFAPQIELAAPLDFEFGPDGALYFVEYGQQWFQANPDSSLSRIEFRRD